ncbi:MAG: hypothetical protein QN163_10720 [Armatimonadota bacterium]|nr:hypothetical protein [Armatimonadota bacterium]MDR5697870.1 hypothetical protein [Armatimonadota bacterium]
MPCLTVVLFLIAPSQTGQVADHLRGIELVVAAFVLYLILAAGLGVATSRLFRLSHAATRTLLFSTGTRNSFVVLPVVLALPAGWGAVTVVVLQPLVELMGMLVYLHWVPRLTARWASGCI